MSLECTMSKECSRSGVETWLTAFATSLPRRWILPSRTGSRRTSTHTMQRQNQSNHSSATVSQVERLGLPVSSLCNHLTSHGRDSLQMLAAQQTRGNSQVFSTVWGKSRQLTDPLASTEAFSLARLLFSSIELVILDFTIQARPSNSYRMLIYSLPGCGRSGSQCSQYTTYILWTRFEGGWWCNLGYPQSRCDTRDHLIVRRKSTAKKDSERFIKVAWRTHSEPPAVL